MSIKTQNAKVLTLIKVKLDKDIQGDFVQLTIEMLLNDKTTMTMTLLLLISIIIIIFIFFIITIIKFNPVCLFLLYFDSYVQCKTFLQKQDHRGLCIWEYKVLILVKCFPDFCYQHYAN